MKKNPDSDSDAPWSALLRAARADTPPPVDRGALLRAVRAASWPARPGWLAEFSRLFSPRTIVPVCLGAAAMVALVTSWQLWDVWQSLPWVQLLGALNGGDV
jgi:hypothetical protein